MLFLYCLLDFYFNCSLWRCALFSCGISSQFFWQVFPAASQCHMTFIPNFQNNNLTNNSGFRSKIHFSSVIWTLKWLIQVFILHIFVSLFFWTLASIANPKELSLSNAVILSLNNDQNIVLVATRVFLIQGIWYFVLFTF